MRIAEAKLVQAVGELQQEGRVTGAALARAFGAFLRWKRLMHRGGKISRALAAYTQEQSGIIPVHVTSAHSLAPAEQARVKQDAARLLGKAGHTTAVEFRQDQALIGGLRLETSDARYDATIARGIKELRKSL